MLQSAWNAPVAMTCSTKHPMFLLSTSASVSSVSVDLPWRDFHGMQWTHSSPLHLMHPAATSSTILLSLSFPISTPRSCRCGCKGSGLLAGRCHHHHHERLQGGTQAYLFLHWTDEILTSLTSSLSGLQWIFLERWTLLPSGCNSVVM